MLSTAFQLLQKPMYQAAVFAGLALVLMALIRPGKLDSLWAIAGVTYLLFILTNAICIWFSQSAWAYFFLSLGFSVLYLFVMNMMVNGYADLFAAEGSGESSMIFLVIIYHPIVLLLAMFLKYLYHKFF